MQLKAEPEMAGKIVRCPGCDTKLSIPAMAGAGLPAPSGLPSPSGLPAPSGGITPPAPVENDAFGAEYEHGASAPPQPIIGNTTTQQHQGERGGWEEIDPTNPNALLSFGIGFGLFALWIAILYPFKAPESTAPATYTTMQFVASLFFKHMLVSFTNTLFFTWSMSILYLKLQKLRHQRKALLLDVLPWELGAEINRDNVGHFIDNLYKLPHRLRDSMMVNRIRKALELFEVKQNTGDVSNMLSSQSDIDSMRIGGSYSLLKAFLWAIPILGFIGTVIGLSHAIGGMNFSNMTDLKQVTSTLGAVTGGLGTAFDATLLGLVLAMSLNFPLNAMMKSEDDCLNDIDAFCNEVLLPRLNDGGSIAGGDTAGIMDTLVKAVANAQKDFLVDLNALSRQIKEQADNLDKRAAAHQQRVDAEFAMTLNRMREDMTNAVKDSVKTTTDYTRALASGIQSLNSLLSELGGKQILIHQVKKKGWFSSK
ncbi:MotA/TolQ/ExbB proton channel family protein [Prosthecobacter vanneervenii]|uniref:Biopolymer transport protein ExbB/TolQ n=1 Tax=Prosthecobacter vanneervenii TaxID=48466 RepID=A0A7W7Y8J7_9BACT|nr:MotA/TolQ/ExbB proton channel family protein [Prosthecobacter vanneervenii]MBB5031586.1 biopolymer transport protein ExbB/TolQ [Prosthecobacter vanneervenii]